MRAILVTGDSQRFARVTRRLHRYLASLGVRHIRTLRTAYRTRNNVLNNISQLLAEDRRDGDLTLLYYGGHGASNGWGINDAHTLRYDDLAELLAPLPDPTVLVNDCCHAYAVVKSLERQGIGQDRFSLIAACSAEDTTRQGMTSDLIASWSMRTAFLPQPTMFKSVLLDFRGPVPADAEQEVLQLGDVEDWGISETHVIKSWDEPVEIDLGDKFIASPALRWGANFDRQLFRI